MVRVDRPADLDVIVGQAHFTTSVEDPHEAPGPHPFFGPAFREASSARLIRHPGNDEEPPLAAQAIGAGHGSPSSFARAGRPPC